MKPSTYTKILAVLMCAVLLGVSTACTAAQENQVLSDIEAVVNLAGSVLSVAQSFGALSTPQAKADISTGEELAQEYSAAASQAITEVNSSDAWDAKVTKITTLFGSVGVGFGPISTPQISAAVQLLTAAVKLLVAQLQSAAPPTPAFSEQAKHIALVPTLKKEGHGLLGFVPGTLTHKLKLIQAKADANVALAGRLKAASAIH